MRVEYCSMIDYDKMVLEYAQYCQVYPEVLRSLFSSLFNNLSFTWRYFGFSAPRMCLRRRSVPRIFLAKEVLKRFSKAFFSSSFFLLSRFSRLFVPRLVVLARFSIRAPFPFHVAGFLPRFLLIFPRVLGFLRGKEPPSVLYYLPAVLMRPYISEW